MFVALPIEFNIGGRVNLDQVERYWKEDISQQARRPFRIMVKIASGIEYIADFEDETTRNKIYDQMDRYFTGKDKTPLYDTEEWG